MSSVSLLKTALDSVIAERHFFLWDSGGKEREIVVKLGAPLHEPVLGLARCPVQITGLRVDQNVYAPAGEDAFIALCYALDLIGKVLEVESKSLNLENRYKTDATGSPAWVWHYMDPDNWR